METNMKVVLPGQRIVPQYSFNVNFKTEPIGLKSGMLLINSLHYPNQMSSIHLKSCLKTHRI